MDATNPVLIGLAGTAGAGKDEVAAILGRLYGFGGVSPGDFLRAFSQYLYRLPADHNVSRDQLFMVANFMRDIDPAMMPKICIFQGELLGMQRKLITRVQTMGEAAAIRERGGVIVGVDADPKVRYERIFSRQRDSEAQKTFEQFLAQDEHENKGLAETGDLRGVRSIIDSADIYIDNDSTLEALETKLKDKLAPLLEQSKVQSLKV